MITLVNYTCAFLEYNENILLLERAANRKFNPNIWSGVGGKIEATEINDPYSACLREINEETGIHASEIQNLALRYILLRRQENVIRVSYIYFGSSETEQFFDTDEGTLHWIPKDTLRSKKFTSTYKEMLKHYFSAASDDTNIFVGTAENANGKLSMCWSKIQDFEE